MDGEIHFENSMKKVTDILGGPTERALEIGILAGALIIFL
jgi:hypothetical protein